MRQALTFPGCSGIGSCYMNVVRLEVQILPESTLRWLLGLVLNPLESEQSDGAQLFAEEPLGSQ